MCIVSFYRNNDQIVLTHNRDEEIKRLASTDVEEHVFLGKTYRAPVDQRAKGTWMFLSDQYMACILNGGKEKTIIKDAHYRLSRGIILLHLLKYNSVPEFIKAENLSAIAPFTIFVYDRIAQESYKLFWNEKELTVEEFGSENFISHSSTTLYTEAQAAYNTTQLENGLQWTPEEIYEKHFALKMEDGQVAPGLATTSITQIRVENNTGKMQYWQLF